MSKFVGYNPIIRARMEECFARQDWEELVDYLGSLTHSAFRSASVLLGDRLMVEASDEDFWAAFRRLTEWNARATLGTMLKASVQRLERKRLDLRHPGFLVLSNYLRGEGHDIDRRKTLQAWVPVLKSEEEILYVFERLGVTSPRERMEYLLRSQSLPAYFALLKTARYLEHDKALLTNCCRYLMKKGDGASFNLASLMKLYFDLPEVAGTFSLRLESYELDRLATSYDAFCGVVDGLR